MNQIAEEHKSHLTSESPKLPLPLNIFDSLLVFCLFVILCQVSKVTTVVNIELPGSEKMYRSMDVVNDRSNSIQQINIIITMFSSICQVGWKRPFCKVGNELCKKSGRREREREHLLCICLILKYTLSAMIGCFS